MSCDLKLGDLLELSKVYAPEYNMPELHDRVLVFDVMQDGWETDAILASSKRRDDSEENSGESSVTNSNEVQATNIKNESNVSEGETVDSKAEIKGIIKQDAQTGSTYGEDSSSKIDISNDSFTLVVTDESPACSEEGILRQHKIFVHSSWLAVQSKYFRSLFCLGIESKI